MQSPSLRIQDFLLLLALLAPLVLGGLWLVEKLRLLSCPIGTFLAGTMRQNFEELAIVMASLSITFLVRNWLVWHTPSLSRIFEVVPQNSAKKQRRAGRRLAQILLASLTLVMMVIVVIGGLSDFCFSDSGMTIRSWPWTNTVNYSWDRVVGVTTSCSWGQRRWNASYVLTLNDGASVDMLGGEPYVAQSYPALVRKLSGVNFSFNSSRVAPNCGHGDVALLRKRP